MATQEKGAPFNDDKYIEVRKGIEEVARGDFADYVTLKELAEITGSSYNQVHYAIHAKVRLEGVKHGIQWFVHWKDAKEYAAILRERRLNRAKHLNNQAARLEKKAERRLKEAKMLAKKAQYEVDKSLGTAEKAVKGTRVPFSDYEQVKDKVEDGDLYLTDAAEATGYTPYTLSTYASPSNHLVKSYIVGGKRVIPASEVERLRRRRKEMSEKRTNQ